MSEVEQAIATIQECLDIHLQWAEFQTSNADWRSRVEPNDVGDPEHHRMWAAKYEQVLRVLTGASEGSAGHAQS